MSTSTLSDGLFRMPVLGADMEEGRVAEWLVEPGQAVERGQIVAVIETDKSDIEVEVFEPCVFEEFLVRLGDPVPVGEPIARVRPVGQRTIEPVEAGPTAPIEEPAVEPVETLATVEPAETLEPVETMISERPGGRRLTPRARRLAAEQGIDVEHLPADRVVTGDMVLAAQSPAAQPPAAHAPTRAADDTDSMRRVIAAAMSKSWAEIPHYHVTGTLDLTDAIERLTSHNADRPMGERIVSGAMLDLAIARAAAETTPLNGWYVDGGFRPASGVDLGIIVSLRRGGIVVPTITGADELSLDELMTRLGELVERARRGRLRSADVVAASLTVTSMGDRGADDVHGIIHPPQVALVGLGRPHEEPMVIDGEVRVRTVARITVAGDHRVSDGLEAARLIDRTAAHLARLP